MRISFIKIRTIKQYWRKNKVSQKQKYVKQGKGQFINPHFFIYIITFFRNKNRYKTSSNKYADTGTQNGTETEAGKQIRKYCVLHPVQIFQY
jgi:hypothetical protein